ncbi:hypothetical protein KAU30_02865, partial [Candidatus Bathyarchaeota archaeon]|nr:hypothetical protein [Candidatus Bathyarchaeota archaeon]
NVTNEVDLFKCASCGTYFIPTRQIDWALERIENEVSEYKDFHSDLKNAMELCLNCRRKISNIRNAKKILAQLSAIARAV